MKNGIKFTNLKLCIKIMEDKALETLKSILALRDIKYDSNEFLGSPIDETRMYNLGGILIIFSEKSRINESNLNSYIKFAEDNSYTQGTIIISLIPCSEKIQNIVRDFINNPENPLLQIFDIKRLQFDITTHRKYVPHRIIKQDEITLLQTKFNIVNPKEQLGWIDSQDASAKWIGARPGNIIEVIRFSQSSADARSWRYCVANTLDT
jgi:DNA-directed RNA polymerase subunit H (RpoH/RPB5)